MRNLFVKALVILVSLGFSAYSAAYGETTNIPSEGDSSEGWTYTDQFNSDLWASNAGRSDIAPGNVTEGVKSFLMHSQDAYGSLYHELVPSAQPGIYKVKFDTIGGTGNIEPDIFLDGTASENDLELLQVGVRYGGTSAGSPGEVIVSGQTLSIQNDKPGPIDANWLTSTLTLSVPEDSPIVGKRLGFYLTMHYSTQEPYKKAYFDKLRFTYTLHKPDAPTIDSVDVGDGQLTVNFTAGSLQGGDFTKYQAATNAAFDENLVESTTESDASLVITGLTNGTGYDVYLRTVSSGGESAKVNGGIHTPAVPPAAPTIDSVTTGKGDLTINFTPGSNGGAFIRYEAATKADFSENLVESTVETEHSIAITGLENRANHTVYLRAVNRAGNGEIADNGPHTVVGFDTAASTIAVDQAMITADGVSTATITVTAIDSSNQPMINEAVVVESTLGTVGDVTDNNDGTYTATLTSDTTTGTATVKATVGGIELANTQTVTFSAGAVNAASSTLSANSASIVADGSSTVTLTVQAKDANGNNLTTGGEDVIFETTAGTVGETTDNNDGTYTATLTSDTTPATVTVSAKMGGAAVSNTVEIIFVARPTQPEDTGSSIATAQNNIAVGGQMANVISSAGRAPLGGLSTDDAQGVNTEDYGRLYVLSAREGDGGFSLVDWFSLGVAQTSVDATLKGSGSYGYALIGSELSKTETSVSGLLYGVETSNWTYETESDVQKSGLSIGYYTGHRLDSLFLTGSAILTTTANKVSAMSGATGETNSTRVLVIASVSGQRQFAGGASLSPYMNFLYATETIGAFEFSDNTSSEASEANVGKISLGVEYTTAAGSSAGQFLVRGEVGQVFGAEPITLNGGAETYTPNEGPTGSLTFGWISSPGESLSSRVELTLGEIGNDEVSEVRLDGTWDRRF